MGYRMEQVNELLKRELANLIARDFPLDNGLITVTFVSCSANLRHAKIGVSVIPDNVAGSTLQELKKYSKSFSNELRKKLNLKTIPKFNWAIDDQTRHAAEMENYINSVC